MEFFRRIILLSFIFLMSPIHAIGEPLNIGIDSYTPPFVMESNNKKLYGFDIDMMNSLCKTMQRTCNYIPMRFEELLGAVADKKVDVAISSITITAERSKTVDFSVPYLLSYSRFLTNHKEEEQLPFNLELLQNKKFGVTVGAAFKDQIKDMGIKNPTIVEYPTTEVMLEDLSKENIDYILLDDPTALYWEANSSGAFIAIGKPYMYGYGIGIAVNQSEKNLLQSINQALQQYQLSNEYKLSYDRYLAHF